MACSLVQTQGETRLGTVYTLICLPHGELGSRSLESDIETLAEHHIANNTP